MLLPLLCCSPSFPLPAVVPPGYYLKGPGQVAPCPKGEYKSGYGAVASCNKCAVGVSTKAEASTAVTDCTEVLPTYFPLTMDGVTVNATQKCIQKFYCPGGSATAVFTPANPNPSTANTVQQCQYGMWTEGTGASSADQCSEYKHAATCISLYSLYHADRSALAHAHSCCQRTAPFQLSLILHTVTDMCCRLPVCSDPSWLHDRLNCRHHHCLH